jgi:hypothetical protein
MEAFEAELVDAVRDRTAGESVPAAFHRFVIDRSARLADEEVAEVIATAGRIIGASSALQAREREIVARYSRVLGRLIAEETGRDGDDVEARAVANALMGAHRALVEYAREQVLAGARGEKLARRVRAQAKRAFDRLERGLARDGERGAGEP